MSKTLQIILGLLALLVALALAAIIIVPLVVDPNDYRDDIARAVEEQTGRSFEIEGEISLSLFPWLGLEVGRMRLGNPPGFGDAPFLEIGSAGVGARLMPLLSRRLEVSTLRLDGLRLNLVQLADGANNWADLGGDEAAPAPDSPQEDGAGVRLDRIGGLRLTDAVVRFEDRKQASIIEAAIANLSTGELAPGAEFPLEAQAVLTVDDGHMAVAANLAANVRFTDDFAAVAVRDLELDAEASGPGVPRGEARAALRGTTIDVDLERMAGTIDDLVLDFEAGGTDVPGGGQKGRVSAPRVSVDLDAQTLAIPTLSAETAGLQIDGDVSGTRIVDAPAFAGRLELREFSPRDLLARLGEPAPDTADGSVLGKATLGARFKAGTDRIELEDLKARLDDTALDGTFSAQFGEVTVVRSRLSLDTIDLDRYLPPESEDTGTAPPAEDEPLAFEWLQGLDLDASLRAGQLKVNGLTLTELEGRAVAKDGVLTLQPFGAALYGGQVRGSARLDARQSPATLSLDQSLSTLQLLPFVKDLADFDRLTGVAQLGAKLTTTASSTAGLMSGLNGELSFDVSDGALKGVNIWYELQRANALARGRAAPQRTSEDTDFRQLKGTAVIRDGLLVNQDLVGGLPFLSLAGRGEVNLIESALDYKLTATVIRQAIDDATGETSELAGASVPLRLSGTLASPSVSVDLGNLLRDQAGQEALRRLGIEAGEGQSAEEALKERATDKARDRLRDLLRRDD
jgi:AsmA protein